MRVGIAVLLLVASPLAGCLEPAPEAPRDADAPPSAGPPPVAWTFTDIEGVVHSNATASGAPAVLFFMATWCSACRAKAPTLAKVHDDYASQGLRTYSVTWDPAEDEDDLRRWQSQHDQPWPHGVDPGLKIQRAFGVTSQSSVVVVDPEGRVVRKWGFPGPPDAALRSAIDEAFAAV